MTDSTHITRLSSAMIPVSDPDQAIAFYVDKLGFEKRMDVPFGDGLRWIEVAPAGAPTPVALTPPGPEVSPGDVNNIGFATADVDATHAALQSRGVDVDDAVQRLGDPVPPMFWARDPDGNVLMFVQRED
jgi:catechol 2,3-dioxygenase-like lactoylglutathione lyase family enzyme